MESWHFDEIEEKLHLVVNGQSSGEVKSMRCGRKLSLIQMYISGGEVRSMCTKTYNRDGSEICKEKPQLEKSKEEPFCVKRNKFIKQWKAYVTAWPSETDQSDPASDPSSEADSQQSSRSSDCDSDQSIFDSPEKTEEVDGSPKKTRAALCFENATGKTDFQDTILKENCLGVHDVHIMNLTPPCASRATRLLDFGHVDALTESFQNQDMGQMVILVGLLTEQVDLTKLAHEQSVKVEVLGGNHTREALQSLYQKGVLSSPTVKVTVYHKLSLLAAITVGYQHNCILQEKKKPMTFIEKVTLMRHCRPSTNMSGLEVSSWKKMLVVIFRQKDTRRLQAGFQQHLSMARQPTVVWEKVLKATQQRKVSEKFFRQLMRVEDTGDVVKCLDTLIERGDAEFKKQVHSLVGKKTGAKKSAGSSQEKENAIDDDEASCSSKDVEDVLGDSSQNYKDKYEEMKNDHDRLKRKYDQLIEDAETMRAELKKYKDCKMVKDKCEKMNAKEKVMALWKFPEGDQWLEATVMSHTNKGVRVQYAEDKTFSTVPLSWIRRNTGAK